MSKELREIREMIDKVKNFKQFVNESVDNDMYHYVIHTGLGNRLDTMGDLYWVKANKNILKSKVWSLFVSKHPELIDTEITQISKDTFDTNANEFEIIDDFKKLTIKENQYLGSCVEVGDDNSCNYINDIFSDASEMAYYVGDPDSVDFGESEEITQDEFFKNVERSIVENKQLKGKVGFYYIPDLKIYYIYNFDDGIHYFYK